jgi:methyl-accepting chemotaxis protein
MNTSTLALFAVLALSLLANIIFILRFFSNKSYGMLNEFLNRIAEGRLNVAQVFPVKKAGNKAEMLTSSYINDMIMKTRAVLKSISSLGFNLTKTSDVIKRSSNQMLDFFEKTTTQSAQVATAMEEMSATINEISRRSGEAAQSIASLMESAGHAERDIDENVRSIEGLSSQVHEWAEMNKALSQATNRIDEIILVINDIASQTNLLALNAAIEAARAGEQGRGFAVVADEVRKLADKTEKATKEIAGMIRDIKTKTESSISTMDLTLQGTGESIHRAKNADASLKKIAEEVKQIADMVNQTAVATEEQSKVSESVLSNTEEVSECTSKSKELARVIASEGDSMVALAINLYSQLCSVKKDILDERAEEILKTGAREVMAKLEQAIKSGGISNDVLFDSAYSRGIAPGKLTARFSEFFEGQVMPMVKQMGQSEKKIIYVVAMDSNGFIAAHNNPSRLGVKMSDPVSINGAKSTQIVGQAFRRPIEAGGELVNDIAHPISVGGRHWGCLRIGYLPEI